MTSLNGLSVCILVKCIFLMELSTESLAVCTFGKDTNVCAFPCNCARWEEACNEETGACPNSGCRQGLPQGFPWGGEGCLVGNVAYNKGSGAYQSGVWGGHDASRAVDGDTNPNLDAGSCAHPEHPDGDQAWWMLNLGSEHFIYNVTVFNRNSNAERMRQFEIRIGYEEDIDEFSECGRYDGQVVVSGNATIQCNNSGSVIGMKIRHNDHDKNVFQLCEFVAMGYKIIDCSACGERCSSVTGCTKCPSGKRLPDCKLGCTANYFGDNCEEVCHCRTGSCHPNTGTCPAGCQDWWVPHSCSIYLHSPDIGSVMPNVKEESVTHDSAIIEWQSQTNIPDDLAPYYGYKIFARTTDGEIVSGYFQHGSNTKMSGKLDGLDADTQYEVYIEPYRNISTQSFNNSNYEAGRTSQTITINTKKFPSTTLPSTPMATAVPPNVGGDGDGLVNDQPVLQQPGDASAQKQDQPNVGMIAGIALAGLALIVVSIIAALLYVRLQSRKSDTGHKRKKMTIDDIQVQKDPVRAMEAIGMKNKGFVQDSEPTSPISTPSTTPMLNTEDVYENVKPESTTPIPIAELAAYVQQKKEVEGDFKREYQSIPQGEVYECEIGDLPQNKGKNRFVNIKAYDHTRVILDVEDDESDYVNANYLTGYKDKEKAYVATQGPKPATVNDMWRLIWQVNTNRLIMVTKEIENGKRKCERYWPEKAGQSNDYGKINVKNESNETYADYTIRIFTATKQGHDSRRIMQFHFTSWPDKKIPDYAFPLLSFRRRVKSYSSTAEGPTLVHCSAGVGRTGTYIALDYLLQQAEAEKQVDVIGYVNTMRTQRINMIQTLEQYIFVYDALIESNQVGETTVATAKLPPSYKQWSRKKPGATMSRIEEQFQHLQEFKPMNKEDGVPSGLREENIEKNRYPDLVASDMNRPYLRTRIDDGTDYINAAFVNSYHSRDQIVSTQMPLPETVADLWRLVQDHSCYTIIMLNEEEDMDQTCGIYWPDGNNNKKLEFGPLEVTLDKTDKDHPNILVRDLLLSHSAQAPVRVRQFVLRNCWAADTGLPDVEVICDVIDLVHAWQQKSGVGQQQANFIVHCMNGIERSGLFCACLHVIDKLRVEQEVDIYTSVKHVKTSHTDFVSSLDMYRFLYEIAQAYILRYDTYSNFK